MPIDPSIALGVQPMRLVNPLDVMQNVQQLRGQRMENEQREEAIRRARAAQAEKNALNAAAQPGGTLDDYLARVTAAGYGRLVPLIRKQWGEADESSAKAKKARADASAAEADYFGGLAASVKSYEADGPDALLNAAQLALQHAKAQGHDVSQIEGVLTQNPAALPQVLTALIQASPTQRGLLDKEKGTGAQVQNAATTADRWNTEKPGVQQAQAIQARTAAAAELAAAPSKDAYAAAYSRLAPAVAAAFPPPAAWNPQTSSIVQRIGMTADQQANNAGAAAGRAETARHNRAMEATAAASARNEPLEAVIDPQTGKPVLRPRSQAVGLMPATNRERTTEDERKSVGWYQQMRDAATTIDALEDKLTQQELYQIQTLPHEQLVGMANRNALSENAKRYFRAFTQFSEARLRSVSGAAISAGEYQSDRQTYGKQFGETPTLAEDRKRAREVVMGATRERAGVAMPKEAAAGSGAHKVGDTVIGPDGKPHKILEVSPDGKRYRLDGGS